MLSRQQIEKLPRLWRIASALVLILGAIIAFIALPGFALPHRIDSHNIPQVWVPPGCFKMGVDPVKEPHVQGEALLAHTVCLTHGYWIDQYDVTNAAFAAFVRSGGYTTDAYWSVDGLAWRHAKAHDLAQSGSSLGVTPASCCACSTDLQQPHNCVSYYEAQAYANWRTQTSQDGLLYRLPTEAEWEYAARGPLDWIYPWGNTFDPSKANTKAAGLGDVTTEGSYPTGASWGTGYGGQCRPVGGGLVCICSLSLTMLPGFTSN